MHDVLVFKQLKNLQFSQCRYRKLQNIEYRGQSNYFKTKTHSLFLIFHENFFQSHKLFRILLLTRLKNLPKITSEHPITSFFTRWNVIWTHPKVPCPILATFSYFPTSSQKGKSNSSRYFSFSFIWLRKPEPVAVGPPTDIVVADLFFALVSQAGPKFGKHVREIVILKRKHRPSHANL